MEQINEIQKKLHELYNELDAVSEKLIDFYDILFFVVNNKEENNEK